MYFNQIHLSNFKVWNAIYYKDNIVPGGLIGRPAPRRLKLQCCSCVHSRNQELLFNRKEEEEMKFDNLPI